MYLHIQRIIPQKWRTNEELQIFKPFQLPRFIPNLRKFKSRQAINNRHFCTILETFHPQTKADNNLVIKNRRNTRCLSMFRHFLFSRLFNCDRLGLKSRGRPSFRIETNTPLVNVARNLANLRPKVDPAIHLWSFSRRGSHSKLVSGPLVSLISLIRVIWHGQSRNLCERKNSARWSRFVEVVRINRNIVLRGFAIGWTFTTTYIIGGSFPFGFSRRRWFSDFFETRMIVVIQSC